ncbi:8102_t:CDS:1 [Funneliformis geosporum]|uniref:17168_t:CDS:1 n=1 Tax=Funneliformis geosporum TaxID=1117311 RepID=A0A9W4SQR0_9GLOM|nr:8102_t:CDS:1 [Funneliformis geosporum]CAI2177456.1 17168_t:CDS:1 [Funneliformis geosporum]
MSKPTPGRSKSIIIDVPKDYDKNDEKSSKEEPKEGPKSGEKIKRGLDLLERVGVKDDIERKISEIDHDTPEEIAKETELITERMNKLDVLITIGLYYTSLIMNWLTLLGESKSVNDFFFTLFLGSFNLKEWEFSDGELSLVAKISGMTTTLQTGLFIFSGLINLGAKALHKPVPRIVGGPMYYGGPFQIIYVFKSQAKAYTNSIKSLDAQISQWLGFFSQVMVIVAASFAAVNRGQALDPFMFADESFIGHGYSPEPNTEDQFGDVISPTNTTQVTMAIQHAALFSKATYMVSISAIIMTSFLNIVQWLADIWRVNNDDLIIYTIFKVLTRALLCQPCIGDKWLSQRGRKGGNVGFPGASRIVPSSVSSSPSKLSPLITKPTP